MPIIGIEDFYRSLDEKRQVSSNGTEYWMGRDIQTVLGYRTWENFEQAVERAVEACKTIGEEPTHWFRGVTKPIVSGRGGTQLRGDFFLSRFGCYLIAMNGDPRIPEVSWAQAYFAAQTRRQEQQDALTEQEKRLLLRERVRNANKYLNIAAKQAGVKRYGLFHDAGYQGLYGMGLKAIKQRRRLPPTEDLLDCAGRVELAANEFRITQTEERLTKEGVKGELAATRTHRSVGAEVRASIKRIGGTMPENLAPEPSIKKLANRKRISKGDSN
jgi:DNA-damage-inducible protein D